MSRLRLPFALIAGCSVAALATAALADPPARVGRVSDVEGVVSFLPPDDQDWAEALRNYPVTSGEAFWTGDSGRAELEIGGVQARLDSETELDVVDLDYGQTRFSIPQGSVDIRVWRVPEGGVTVATPAGDVQLNQAGAFRIDVGAPDDNGDYPPVEVTALDGGDAGAPGPGGFVDVPVGTAAVIYGGYEPELDDAMDASIDDWARDRETQLRYDQVNWQQDAAPGYADLSNYGQFVQDPTYGQVWYPTQVPADWAPYRYGQWSYVQPWGWTWVDDQPWGFTPFHYGRWANVGGRWGWVAGQAERRPVYAPALVAFIGGAGIGVGVGVSGGAFAWVPLAPDEPYIPPYHVSEAYARQVNVANVSTTVINNININNTTVVGAGQLKNAGAVSAISTQSLAQGAKVQQATVHVTPAALAQARVTPSSSLPAAPKPSGPGGSKGAGASGLHSAPPPPAKVQQVRAAVAHAPPGSTAPPPIPGVHKAAAKPAKGAAPPVIAPAAKSGHQPPPKPLATHPAGAPKTSPGPAGGTRTLPPQAPGSHGASPTTEMRRPPGETQTPPAGPPAKGATTAPLAPKTRTPVKPPEGAPPTQSRERPGKTLGAPAGQAAHPPTVPPKTTVGASNPPPKKQLDKKTGETPTVGAPPKPPERSTKAVSPPAGQVVHPAIVAPKTAPVVSKPPPKKPPEKKDETPKKDPNA